MDDEKPVDPRPGASTAVGSAGADPTSRDGHATRETPDGAKPDPVSSWAPLARPVYRALWIAQLASNVGAWMQTVGAQWFLVEQTHSAALVAWVQTAALLPVLLLSLGAGVLADLFDRRRLLMTTTSLSIATAAVMWLLALWHGLTPGTLLLLTFLLGSWSALSTPAFQAITPELVPRSEIAAAASLSSVTINGARAVGPALAGVIIGFAGPTPVLGLNAVSFIGVLVILARWKRPRQQSVLDRERFSPALAAGLRYVRAAPQVRRILLRSVLFAVPACALWALLPTVAQNDLHLSASGYGLLLGVLGAGSVLGVVVLPKLRLRMSDSWILAASALSYAIGLVAAVVGSLPVVLAAFVLTGIAWIATLTTLNAAMQLTVPDWVRARAMAVYLLVFMGGQGVASFLWGLAADAVGTRTVFLVAAGMLLLVGASVPSLPLVANTGRLDRTVVALLSDAPALVFSAAPGDGPVVVARTHLAKKGMEDEFVAAMAGVQLSRRRTGASSWSLHRSGDTESTYREEFTVPSWGEFLRDETVRWTEFDRTQLDRADTLVESPPREEHYFPLAAPRRRRRDDPVPPEPQPGVQGLTEPGQGVG